MFELFFFLKLIFKKFVFIDFICFFILGCELNVCIIVFKLFVVLIVVKLVIFVLIISIFVGGILFVVVIWFVKKLLNVFVVLIIVW